MRLLFYEHSYYILHLHFLHAHASVCMHACKYVCSTCSALCTQLLLSLLALCTECSGSQLARELASLQEALARQTKNFLIRGNSSLSLSPSLQLKACSSPSQRWFCLSCCSRSSRRSTRPRNLLLPLCLATFFSHEKCRAFYAAAVRLFISPRVFLSVFFDSFTEGKDIFLLAELW